MRGRLEKVRLLGGGDFKVDFLDTFVPLHPRERKMQEFINLRQEGTSVEEYSLKFIQQSKYAPTMVVDS